MTKIIRANKKADSYRDRILIDTNFSRAGFFQRRSRGLRRFTNWKRISRIEANAEVRPDTTAYCLLLLPLTTHHSQLPTATNSVTIKIVQLSPCPKYTNGRNLVIGTNSYEL